MWDPDGNGPKGPLLVIGGSFTFVGNTFANHCASYDPATRRWTKMDTGIKSLSGPRTLVVRTNGELLAGEFKGVLRWDGSAWVPATTEFVGSAYAILERPTGDLIVGGTISNAGGKITNGIARWDAALSEWFALGSGMGSNTASVSAIAALGTVDVIVAGSFLSAGGVNTKGVARWDGTAWHALGSGLNKSAMSVITLSSGDVIVGGSFATAGGVPASGIARWKPDTGQWSSLGSGLAGTNLSVKDIRELPNGDLIAAGRFSTAGGVSAMNVARWSNASGVWTAMPPGVGGASDQGIATLAMLPDGDIVAAGTFNYVGNQYSPNITRWESAAIQWSDLGSSIDSAVFAIEPSGDTAMYIGGVFKNIGSLSANHIARWDDVSGSWSALGQGTDSHVYALALLQTGKLVVGGYFNEAGGTPAKRIAAWNPDTETWEPLGTGMDDLVRAIEERADGTVVAAGDFTSAGGAPANRIARWDGASWFPLGSGLDNDVHALATLGNGDLVAAGQFTQAGGVSAYGIARWDGTQWHTTGAGANNIVRALAELPDGSVLVGGAFTQIDGKNAASIARWNGLFGGWSTLGAGIPLSSPPI